MQLSDFLTQIITVAPELEGAVLNNHPEASKAAQALTNALAPYILELIKKQNSSAST